MTMIISLVLCAFTTILVGLIGRLVYIVVFNHEMSPKDKYKTVRTLIILGSGGHTTEMLRIVKNLDFLKYTPRVYVHAHTDTMSVAKLQEIEGDSNDFKVVSIFRSREVGQSYITSIGTTLIAIRHAFSIIFNEKPDLILCNGPGTGVPLCLGAFVLRLMFLSDSKIIFIESFCRVKTFSLTGKILYYFANHVIVQWPQLCTKTDKYVHFIK